MTHLKLVEKSTRHISDDEDYIALYDDGTSYIYYIRNYEAQTEFLLLSSDLIQMLPEGQRALTGVYLKMYFTVLKTFKDEILGYLDRHNRRIHFYHLFDCQPADFIDML